MSVCMYVCMYVTLSQFHCAFLRPPHALYVYNYSNNTYGLLMLLLKLIRKHFPKNNPLSKIINRNTVKMSYKCTPNMSQIISSHNSKVLKKEESEEERKCNCSKNNVCPLGGKCLEKNVIYQAKVTTTSDPSKTETYVGLCATTFKDRYRNHKSSFKHQKNSNTTLSRHIWDLKSKNIDYQVTWKILDRAKPFSPVTPELKTYFGVLYSNSFIHTMKAMSN